MQASRAKDVAPQQARRLTGISWHAGRSIKAYFASGTSRACPAFGTSWSVEASWTSPAFRTRTSVTTRSSWSSWRSGPAVVPRRTGRPGWAFTFRCPLVTWFVISLYDVVILYEKQFREFYRGTIALKSFSHWPNQIFC